MNSLKYPKWGTFDTSKLIIVYALLEKAGSKIELNEWNTCFVWKIKASSKENAD